MFCFLFDGGVVDVFHVDENTIFVKILVVFVVLQDNDMFEYIEGVFQDAYRL